MFIICAVVLKSYTLKYSSGEQNIFFDNLRRNKGFKDALRFRSFFMVNIKRTGIEKKGTLSLQDIIDFAKKNPNSDKVGAIATFTGIVRGYTHEGENVQKLELESYEEVAERTLQNISDELMKEPGIVDVLIHHLIGTFTIGEEMVYVVVTGRSRKEVFSTLITAVERYKHEVAVWKKEYLTNGRSYWISEK